LRLITNFLIHTDQAVYQLAVGLRAQGLGFKSLRAQNDASRFIPYQSSKWTRLSADYDYSEKIRQLMNRHLHSNAKAKKTEPANSLYIWFTSSGNLMLFLLILITLSPLPFIHSFIHSLILNIYIAPLQENYSEMHLTFTDHITQLSYGCYMHNTW